jgi:NADH-quinone oxidoreductase subunit B
VHVTTTASTRRLEVTSLNLACCAVESATGLELWEAQQSQLAAQSGSSDSSHRDVPSLHVLVVAGTVTKANAELVRDKYDALPAPRAVVAFGACTISGGPYWDSYAVLPGIDELVPVDIFVSGCPPQASDLVAALAEVATR